MMTRFKSTVLAAALALAASPASAAAPQDFSAWLAQAVDRAMVHPTSLQRSEASGIASVAFEIKDGRATDIRIVESSGNRAIDRAALRTIAALDLPAGAPAGPHVALLQYGVAASGEQLAAHQARLGAATDRASYAMRSLDENVRLVRRGGIATRASTID